MKARIVKIGNWWYGQVYTTWNSIFSGKYTGWNTVTKNHYTYMGAKISLNSWLKANCPKEFEI